MELHCVIIDDEPLALDLLESYIQKTPFLIQEGKYSSAVETLSKVDWNQIDIIFLDIQMPDLNGLEFSRMLPNRVRIIFTTAFQQYALDGFRANALDYLLKPFSYTDFMEAVKKALEWFQMKNSGPEKESADNDFIYVKSDYKLIQIALKDILYIEGLKDYLKIYLENEARPIITLASMKSMEERLPSPRFMRVHRSYIVQTVKVKTLERGVIVFGKTRIPVSESYKSALMNFLNEHTV